jgi:hypothetical protein
MSKVTYSVLLSRAETEMVENVPQLSFFLTPKLYLTDTNVRTDDLHTGKEKHVESQKTYSILLFLNALLLYLYWDFAIVSATTITGACALLLLKY